ncbi:hypothetical protein AXG93_2121s1190 [Marchantia polymorpha subsp. ruderalis]|uniref:LRAT domain-containing protein n=1 Tax=Marchantia polymorpha subsp. ruderalis TaxID=1480154 RepID=A0A176WDV4_MARPO|nr:hypothetical protein AXG93_2121s1190 [Marchantia polymorpha subsp. ruderalis]
MGVLSNRVLKEDLLPGDHIYSWRSAYTYAHHVHGSAKVFTASELCFRGEFSAVWTGIYCGGNKVVHFTRGRNEELGTGNQYLDVFLASSRPDSATHSCTECGMHGESNGVVESCLTCFLAGCPLYRFEYGEKTITFLAKARGGTCTLAETDPAEVVLHRAEYLLNNGFGCYHIFHNNCEDFAIYCKTGLLVVEKNLIGRSGQAASVFGAPFAAVISSPLRFMMANPWGAAAVSAGVYFFCRYATDIGIRKDVAKVAVEDLAVNLGWSQVAALGALDAARTGSVSVQGLPGPCLLAIEAAVPTHAQVADVADSKELLEVDHCKNS